MDHQVHQEHQVTGDHQENRAFQGHLAQLGPQEHQEAQVHQVLLDLQDLTVRPG